MAQRIAMTHGIHLYVLSSLKTTGSVSFLSDTYVPKVQRAQDREKSVRQINVTHIRKLSMYIMPGR
jgi:hypothetical protein